MNSRNFVFFKFRTFSELILFRWQELFSNLKMLEDQMYSTMTKCCVFLVLKMIGTYQMVAFKWNDKQNGTVFLFKMYES